MKFNELKLNNKILKGIEEAGFIECLGVQTETIPRVLQRKDVLAQSQTGTGKTAAFLIPLFQLLMDSDGKVKALVVAPTRELAVQIDTEATLLGKYTGLKTGCFYGGVGYGAQEKLLLHGVDIIIGTPGRLIDLNNRKSLLFRDVGYVVIDEADRLFDMGFMPDLRKILKKLKPKSERMTMLFSATLTYQVKSLAREYMNEPDEIEMNPEQVTVDKINQVLYHIGSREKIYLLLGILKKENPKNGIIFVNTKSAAYEVSSRLAHNNYKCEFLMGDLDQNKRLKIIDDFKSGKIPFLIATDVASRGLHIEDLEMVVNYDLPSDCESYVHRIGRTARVGKSGKAISFACEKFVYGLQAIEDYIKMKIPVEWYDENMLIVDESEGMVFRLNRTNLSVKPERKRDRDMGGRKREKDKGDRNRDRDRDRGERKRRDFADKKETVRKKMPDAVLAEESRMKNTRNRKRRDDRESDNRETKKLAAPKTSANAAQERHIKEEKKDPRKSFNKKKKGRSLDERLEYYKDKYGENFIPSSELVVDEKSREKIPILKKIFSFFKKK